jgi:hypothetical protein
VPARVVVRVAGDMGSGAEIALSWRLLLLHGARTRRLTLPSAGAPAMAGVAAATPAPRLDAADPAGAARPASADVRRPPARARRRGLRARLANVERTVAVVQRLVARHALRVAHVDGWLEFALHDVAETGRAFGFACALATLVDPDGRLALQPRWDTEDWLAADLRLELRVHPLRTLLVLLAERFRHRASAGHAVESATTGGPLAA